MDARNSAYDFIKNYYKAKGNVKPEQDPYNNFDTNKEYEKEEINDKLNDTDFEVGKDQNEIINNNKNSKVDYI